MVSILYIHLSSSQELKRKTIIYTYICIKLGYFESFVHYLYSQVPRLLNSKWVFVVDFKSHKLFAIRVLIHTQKGQKLMWEFLKKGVLMVFGGVCLGLIEISGFLMYSSDFFLCIWCLLS